MPSNSSCAACASSNDTLLTYQEAADYLGVSVRTLSRMIVAGEVSVTKVSRSACRVTLAELRRYVADNTVRCDR